MDRKYFLCDKNAEYLKENENEIFQFLEKNLQEFYKNLPFVTSTDDITNDGVI